MWEWWRSPNPISGRGGVSGALCTPVSASDLKRGNLLKAIVSLKTQHPCCRIYKSLWKPLCSNNFKKPEKESRFSSNGIFTT